MAAAAWAARECGRGRERGTRAQCGGGRRVDGGVAAARGRAGGVEGACGRAGGAQLQPQAATALRRSCGGRQYLRNATAAMPGAMAPRSACLAALLRAALLAVALLQAPPPARATSPSGADAGASPAVGAGGGAAPGVSASDAAAAQEAAGELLERLENEAGSGATPDDELEFYKRLYDFGVGKRAYSYVSEYKRLPVYNFGLGKRAGGRQYGFGLGKRAGGRQYGFGLGKRTPGDEDDYYFPDEEEEDVPEDNFEDSDGVDKRDRLYSFGLGKRSRPFGFGLGKRAGMYSFGLGKRAQHQYSFGLGKRGEGRMYSFGLGKRPNYERMAGSRFNFGLGKRADANPAYLLSDLGEEKRGPDHRFAFGLGKREVSPNELEAVRVEQLHHDKEAQPHELAEAAPAAEREPNDARANGKHAVKRSLHYGFGIGKRTSDAFGLDVEPEEDDRDAISEDFTRYIRRPYSFGLGKRVPMYDFGIGKRADR